MADNIFKEKLYNIIHDSSLGEDQIVLWDLFMRISRPHEDEAVYEALMEGEKRANLDLLSQHLRDKIFSMKIENKKMWKEILAEEERFANLFNE